VIGAADEVIDSIDREELAKFFALKNDPEEEEAEVPNLVFNNSCYSIADSEMVSKEQKIGRNPVCYCIHIIY